MTITQQQYERAAAIARRDALTVVAHGTVKATGAAVYAVPSRSRGANFWHLVTVNGLHLACDCVAGRYGKYCAHCAAVRARLELEAEVSRDSREREAERAFHAAARELAQVQPPDRRESARPSPTPDTILYSQYYSPRRWEC